MEKTMRKTRRISARLAPRAYKMVEELAALTGQSVSGVLEHSIENYHQGVVAARREPWKLLAETGLINSGTAARNLSGTYKTALAKALRRKHPVASPAGAR